MASACVNNIAMSPERFPSAAAAAYGWLSPRMSFSREEDSSKTKPSTYVPPPPPPAKLDQPETVQDPAADFEFLLGEDPTAMLPADELFSDGKLVPLLATAVSKTAPSPTVKSPAGSISTGNRSHRRILTEATISAAGADSYLFSPKAPRCSSRWRELLGLRKLNPISSPNPKMTPSNLNPGPNPKSLKHFLHRTSRSNPTTTATSSSAPASNTSSFLNHSLSLPLLKDAAISDSESISITSSRLSLSSSSSGHDTHDDLPRLSLDSELGPNPFLRNPNPPRIRMARKGPTANSGSDELHSVSGAGAARQVSVDSPRMNSSGKIVFQSLERSSSSPSTFNGNGGNGGRIKHRGMERSYSANVRVTPVLNVPVCSLRGTSKSGTVFGFFSASSPQKREPGSSKHINANSKNRKGSELTSNGS